MAPRGRVCVAGGGASPGIACRRTRAPTLASACAHTLRREAGGRHGGKWPASAPPPGGTELPSEKPRSGLERAARRERIGKCQQVSVARAPRHRERPCGRIGRRTDVRRSDVRRPQTRRTDAGRPGAATARQLAQTHASPPAAPGPGPANQITAISTKTTVTVDLGFTPHGDCIL